MAKTLDDIFDDDEEFGLLNSKGKSLNIKTEEDRLIDSFEEVNTFFEKNGREPSTSNMSEYNLMARLKGFRDSENKKKILKPFDRFDLLGHVDLERKTFDEVLNDDDLGLLDTTGDKSIFEFNHTPQYDKRANADFIAQRKSIKENEFLQYERIFSAVHSDLSNGKRKLINYVGGRLQESAFYVLDGIMLFLEYVEFQSQEQTLEDGTRIRKDGRTRCIFENATESKMRYRSLEKSLYKNGKVVTHNSDDFNGSLFSKASLVTEEDAESGWIYILKSKSTDPKIVEIKNLYKIGFSTVDVAERIKNASKEATYLFSNVEIIATFRCYNINTKHFENLIHRFFAKCCLNVDIYKSDGTRYIPREWFIVPLSVIEEAAHLIISGEILNYKYDEVNMRLKFFTY